MHKPLGGMRSEPHRLPGRKLSVWSVLFVIFVSFGACSFGDPLLSGLLDDPVADFEPSGAEMVTNDRQAEGSSFFEKPVHAKVVRTFRIDDRENAAAVLAEVVAFVESAGWTLTERAGDSYVGSKELPDGPGRIYITLHPWDGVIDHGGPLDVTISLQYDRRLAPAG